MAPNHTKKRSPGRPPRKRAEGSRPSSLRIRWTGFRPMFDYWGNPIERYYQLDTLANAVDAAIVQHDRIVRPTAQRVLGPSPITNLTFELFQEGRYQLIFRLRAANAKHKQASFSFVAAKQAGNVSKLAEQEHANLRVLHERDPEHIARPFLGGTVHLAASRRSGGKARPIFVYTAQWLSQYHELGVARNLCFIVNVKERQHFTMEQTEDLKGQMIGIMARTYDPQSGTCMEVPQIASGDFVVTKPSRGRPKLKLIACRRLLRRMSPVKLIDAVASAEWEWGNSTLHLLPREPRLLLDSLAQAIGREEAASWLLQYVKAARDGKIADTARLPLKEVERLGKARPR